MPESEDEARGILNTLRSVPFQPRAVNGNLSFAGGVDFASPKSVQIDQLDMLVNGTVRDGRICPRPGYDQLHVDYLEARDQQVIERGKVQGYGYFNGQTAWAIDGHLFLYYPGGRLRRVDPLGVQPFSRSADFVWFEQRTGTLIAQDGINPAVIIEGGSGRFAKREIGEVFVGTSMADGWGRLALADTTRRRVYFSDHEANPNSQGLRFADEINSYYLSAPYFTVPGRIGRIVAMEFLPFLDTDTGVGPLLVFGTNGTIAYNVNVPREQWGVQDIALVPLPTLGAAGPRALVALAAELVFIDQNGRLRTIRNARDEESTVNTNVIDRGVYPLYRDESPTLRKYRMVWKFDDRLFSGIQPRSVPLNDTGDQHNVYMNGMIVRELDPSPPYANTEESVWAGLWTGVRPLGVVTGHFDGQERCVILSRDQDGKNRFYEQTKRQDYDRSVSTNGKDAFIRKQIEGEAWLRQSNFGNPKEMKELKGGILSLEDISGPIEIRGRWQSDNSNTKADWFQHHDHFSEAALIDYSLCRIVSAQKGSRRPIDLPALPVATDRTGQRLERFIKGRPIIAWKGSVCLSEIVLTTGEGNRPGRNLPVCEAPEAIQSHCIEPDSFYWYHAASAPDMTAQKCPTSGELIIPEKETVPAIPAVPPPLEQKFRRVDLECEPEA